MPSSGRSGQDLSIPGSVFDYTQAGFDPFLSRSIDGTGAPNLAMEVPLVPNQAIAFDQTSISGMLGDKLKIGSVTLDGANGRISVFDTNNNEVVRVGELSG